MSSSHTRAYPLVTAKGEGSVIEDVDGNCFLDCAAGIAVATTGHSHPDVVRAVVEQARRYLHVSVADCYAEGVVRLAEALVPILSIDGGVRCFFSNSGTEAVEAALKLARYHTKRPYLIVFLSAFHGRTMGSLAMTGSRARQRRGFAPLMAGIYHASYAECYRCPLNLKPESCEAERLEFVEEQLLVHLVEPDEVAAIVVEPIQGEGGYLVAPAKFLQRLVEIARRYGMLLVMDEVQSGMGRTGKMFACEHADVQADIVVIASGMPLGITAAQADVMNWPPGAHASTFGGNPVSCAAALVTIRMVREQMMANAAAVGARLLAGLRRLTERHPLIGDVRGRGLMIGSEQTQSVTPSSWPRFGVGC